MDSVTQYMVLEITSRRRILWIHFQEFFLSLEDDWVINVLVPHMNLTLWKIEFTLATSEISVATKYNLLLPHQLKLVWQQVSSFAFVASEFHIRLL